MFPKPLPRTVLKRLQARVDLKDDRKAKAEVKAADGYRCRCCGAKDGVDCHEHKRRGAGGAITLANSFALCRVCHDLIQARHIQVEQDGETFNARLPILFVMSQRIADALFPHGRIPKQVHVVQEGV